MLRFSVILHTLFVMYIFITIQYRRKDESVSKYQPVIDCAYCYLTTCNKLFAGISCVNERPTLNIIFVAIFLRRNNICSGIKGNTSFV